jgi:hypothetical protein
MPCPIPPITAPFPHLPPSRPQLFRPISPTSRKIRVPSCSRPLRLPRRRTRLRALRSIQPSPKFRRVSRPRLADTVPLYEIVLDHAIQPRAARFDPQNRPPGYCDRAARGPGRTCLPGLPSSRRRPAQTPTDADWSAIATDMDRNVTPLERAFQLARSGKVSSLDDIRKALKQEGYDPSVVQDGASLKTQLNGLLPV